MTPVTIPTSTRPISLPDYGLDPVVNPVLISKLRNMPAWLRDSIINPEGTK
jgi:hypothetical protein